MAACVACGAGPAAAQVPGMELDDPELVDRVAAVVGDSIILLTQVVERVQQLQAQGMTLPSEPAALERLQREVLDALVNEQLILQAALRDTTLSVAEDQVEDIVNRDIEGRIRSFGGQAAMQQALAAQGLTMASFRENLRAEVRKQQLLRQYLARSGRTLDAIPVPEEEIRAYFEARGDQLPERPATVTFTQVIVHPEPTDSARAAARAEAQRIRDLAVGGEDFEALARRLSQDPGSRQSGGDLGWFRRGAFVREFEQAAFVLRDGQISPVVETMFGYHVIKVERSRGAERKARHILIRPEVTADDAERARALATDLRRRAEGGEPMAALIRAHGDTTQPDTLSLPMDRLDELPPGYAAALRPAAPGDVVGPLEFGPADRLSIAVVRVEEIREAGTVTFEDVRDQIREMLRQEKVQERIFQDLRARSYVEIRI